MEQFFELSSHKLAYRIHETPGKPRVLFLHGLGADHSQFDREFESVLHDFSAASISLRGQGDSTRPAGNNPDDMKISELASDVIQWIHAHAWYDSHVIACSMGGVVALEILHQESKLLKSLITFGTTPKLAVSPNAIAVGAMISDMILPGLFPNWMARMLPKKITDKPESRKRFEKDLQKAYVQRRTIYQLRCKLSVYDYIDVLKSADIPVLLLQGTKDTSINASIKKIWPLIKENPLVQREFLDDAGHIANYDQPQAFFERIMLFIKAHEIKPEEQSKADSTRKRILEHALEEFALQGYSKASTKHMMDKAGMAKGLLFHYFSSKKNLYIACVDDVFADVQKKLDVFMLHMPDDLFLRLEKFLLWKHKLAVDHPLTFQFLLGISKMPQDVKAEANELINSWRKRNALLLDNYDSTPWDSSINQKDALSVLVLFFDALDQRWMQSADNSSLIDNEDLLNYALRMLKVLKTGFYQNG